MLKIFLCGSLCFSVLCGAADSAYLRKPVFAEIVSRALYLDQRLAPVDFKPISEDFVILKETAALSSSLCKSTGYPKTALGWITRACDRPNALIFAKAYLDQERFLSHEEVADAKTQLRSLIIAAVDKKESETLAHAEAYLLFIEQLEQINQMNRAQYPNFR